MGLTYSLHWRHNAILRLLILSNSYDIQISLNELRVSLILQKKN
jgi:hypothetical protein